MKNVLLIGIGGVYNYGCEAIVRGTVEILKGVDPTINVSYASYNYEDDVKRLSTCDVSIIKRPKRKRWTFHNVVRKLCSYINYDYLVPFDSTGWVNGFDTLFSIGGDIYTLSSNGAHTPSLAKFCEECSLKKGLKYIVWGASIGRFESNPDALAFYKKHLLIADLIVVRETNTQSYLKTLGIEKKVCLAPDPAFFVPADIFLPTNEIKKNKTLNIGINLSPLSALYHYKGIDAAIVVQAKSIDALIDQLDCNITFLPHVLSLNSLDNDLSYMNEILKNISKKNKSKVFIVDDDPQFIGLKNVIARCDVVIAARMHCAVNAISVGLPTVFLSYSEKAKGMSEFVYGSNQTAFSLFEFEDTTKLVSLIKKWHFKSKLLEIKRYDFNQILNL